MIQSKGKISYLWGCLVGFWVIYIIWGGEERGGMGEMWGMWEMLEMLGMWEFWKYLIYLYPNFRQ